jgi:peptidoglycan/LPS O-acetylase OafA/YrhL
LIVSLAACAAWMALVHSIGAEPSDFVTGAVFTVAIFLVVHAPRRNSDDRGTRKGALATRMALFSYTLYLVHLPALVLIRAALQHHGIGLWQPSPVHLAIATAITAAVVVFAWGVSLITEKQTDRVRLLIGRVIREPGASPARSTLASAPAHD